MNSRLYRLTALHQRIDNALRRLTILRSFDGFELIRLNALKLRQAPDPRTGRRGAGLNLSASFPPGGGESRPGEDRAILPEQQ